MAGQHRAGKHSAAGKKRAAEQPREPKSNLVNPKKGSTSHGVYSSDSGKGLIGRLFGRK
jgi:hypothetical protein